MKNKLFFILGVCFFIFPLSIGNTEEGIYINGYDWQKWPTGSKISFVEGWAKCGKAAKGNLIIYFNNLNESIKQSNAQQESFKDAGILLGGVTIGQVVDSIDEIYSDPRLKTIDITEIMPLVSGRLMQGWTANELDGLIAIKIKLTRCETEEKAKGQFTEECSLLRKKRNSYLQMLKKK
ncbi:MAG: hypothetical protein ABIN18_09075 [Pseudomonadota bacterium]